MPALPTDGLSIEYLATKQGIKDHFDVESGTPSNADQLQWNSTSGLWEFVAPGAPAAHDIEGASHTAAGLTVGEVLRATGATTFAFQALVAGDIPNLDAAKITTGTFAVARIPNLAASKITTGTFADARIAQSNVTQHEAALSIAATQLTGTIADARISGAYTGLTLLTVASGGVTGVMGPGAGPATANEFGVGTTSAHHLVLYANNVEVLTVEADGELTYFGNTAKIFRPNADAVATLGSPLIRWQSLYVGKASGQTQVAIEADGQIVSNRIDKGTSGAGTVTFNWHHGNAQRIDATGNFTAAFSNGIAGGSYVIEYEADGTLRSPDLTTNLNWGNASVPTLPTTNGDKLLIVIFYDGATYHASSNGVIF